jgi:quinol monooxygenase YgiN
MAKRRTREPTFKRSSRKASSPAKRRLPEEAITLTVVLRAKEGMEGALEAELGALVASTRREEGCLTFDLHRAADSPGAFLLHEVWASREHHSRHRQTPHFLRWNARKDALLASRDASFWKLVV